MKLVPTFLLLVLPPLVGVAGSDVPAAAEAEAQATNLTPVKVKARRDADHASSATAGFGAAGVHDTPAAITVIDRDQLEDRHVRSLSELARLDASMGDNYGPVGYYQNISIRGFPLDLGTSYRSNNLTVVGEQRLALESIARVEVLKGLAGLQAGVMEPGGVVNFVTKRPEDVRSVTVGTDQHGTRRVALDVGGWLTPDFGLRGNFAWEDLHSYVQHADGRRNFYALAADWRVNDAVTLQMDGNDQTSAQDSASGYQLLGGTEVPSNPEPERMLGYQPWQQPVTIDSVNISARLKVSLAHDWRLAIAAGHSRSVIQDNVAFAYGCYYTASCAAAGTPGNFFAPNGDYDIYDYRSPDDTRVADELRATLVGSFRTGVVRHAVSFGANGFERTVHNRRDVNEYVGSANIDDVEPPYFAPSPLAAGPLVRTLDSRQASVFVLDRMHFGAGWQWLVGGREVRLHERAWDDDDGTLERATRISRVLPHTALLWQPMPALTTYASYSEGLSLGKEAPFWTSNDGAFLGPRVSRQVEVGAKWRWRERLDLDAALFRIREPWQHAMPDGSAAGFTFVQRGEEVHGGLELAADGQINASLGVHASIAWIKAEAEASGTPAYEGHQLVNVPRLRSSLQLMWRLPTAGAWTVTAGWRHVAANPATPDGKVKVDAYDVFDAGLRHTATWHDHDVTWRLGIANITGKVYWRDTGSAYGDSYLFPGAPRLARLSVKVDW